MPPRSPRSLCAAVLAALAPTASAVSLNLDGGGQALIFPYYTVQVSEGSNAFNTYLSVVNTDTRAKAVRVRVREGRNARAVVDFNLYLSPNDVWAAAIVPTGVATDAVSGTRLVTVDRTCTDPAFTEAGGVRAFDFSFTNLTDGFGTGPDRLREGYVEMIEMATLTGAAAAAITHNSAGVPNNCAAVQATGFAPQVEAPGGGLFGTLTLINVNSGQDFTLQATALADLATRPYFRVASDPYPDFAAAEIDPVSVVMANGQVYRSVWSRPVDAVSAVLMRSVGIGEYILDNPTASLTDFVLTLPTRHHYVGAASTLRPFSAPAGWRAECGTTSTDPGEILSIVFFNREERGAVVAASGFGEFPPSWRPQLCGAVGVATVRNPGAAHIPADMTRTAVLGSTTRGLAVGGSIPITSGFQNGWIRITPLNTTGTALPAIASLPQSTRLDPSTGLSVSGPHTFLGLPVVGFMARTFRNGTLNCVGGACQGNYGGAFDLKYQRIIGTP
jgi:hypothetical protein